MVCKSTDGAGGMVVTPHCVEEALLPLPRPQEGWSSAAVGAESPWLEQAQGEAGLGAVGLSSIAPDNTDLLGCASELVASLVQGVSRDNGGAHGGGRSLGVTPGLAEVEGVVLLTFVQGDRELELWFVG